MRNGGGRMQCPKCGGEIPFLDLKPNCRHCGVNIMYYAQEAELSRDAKRTELEAAAARMVIAQVKVHFIGGRLQILRIICMLAAVAALLAPLAQVHFTAPFFDSLFSVGLIGLIQAAVSGFAAQLPHFFSGTLSASATRFAVVSMACLLAIVLLDVVMIVLFLFGFPDVVKSTKRIRDAALTGTVVSAVSQIVVIVLHLTTPDTPFASTSVGFGSLCAMVVFLILYALDRNLLRQEIVPEYREYDPQRKEILRKVRSGEIDLDELSLPVLESEQECVARMHALEEALRAEEEGKA